MIPKTIHYIWLGTNEPDERVKRCMQSWQILKENGWTIKKWDDSCLQLFELPKVVLAALEHKKYAFASDWLRLRILYSEGGLYFDTDVEVVKGFDDLLKDNASMFLGYLFQSSLGTAVIGAEAKNQVIGDLLKPYETAEYFEGYSLCTNHNYAIHHCQGSWFEDSEEKCEMSKLYAYLRKSYFVRWLEDKCMRKGMIKYLPFQHYLVKK